ncbi:putative MFS allantoate transporter [Aureobasidium sp. EXF-10727]|nr:putative MFS allantoate transporter [Aureobasidium sp. EXF-10727]
MSETEKSTVPFDAEKDLPGPLADAIRNGSVDKSILQHAGDADEALKAFMSHPGEVIELDEATNKRLLRKIDWNLMPVMCIVYGLNYLDKTTLSYASFDVRDRMFCRQSGLRAKKIRFYFGYIAWEYPTNRLLQRLPLGKYSAANIILWGMTLCTFAAVKNFSGGVAWYTKKEQGSRTSIWFSFNGFAQIFGGLVAYGIAKGTRLHGSSIEPWKIIFLVTGCLTICIGFIFLWVVPDSQLNARFLSKEDRVLAIERVRCNQQGIGNKHFKMYQLKEALLDPLTWAFFFYALVADIPNGGISNFFSQLITSFGYSAEESLLYGTPGGAVEVIALIVCGYLGDRYGNRLLISTSGLWISTLGMLLIVCLPLHNNIGRLFGYYLTQASPTPFVALLSLISTNVAGWTKKTTVAALYLIGYCAGNIIGPQTFRPKDAPRYIPAEIVIIVCYLLCIVDIVFIYWYCKRQNKKRAAIRASESYVKLENQEWLDLTDRENPEFVYTL